MKIIDFEKKGNAVRFYVGKNNLKDWHGDDWDDCPYEHNAGTVYSEYTKGHFDVAFNIEYDVLEPQDDWHYNGNSPFCKDDFKDRKAPCIVIKENDDPYNGGYEYSEVMGDDKALRIYYGDDVNATMERIVKYGGNCSKIKNTKRK